jgi:hypothetical protein
MNTWIASLIMYVIEKLVTPNVMNGVKKSIVDFFQSLVEKTDNPVDDHFLKILKEFLGVK